MNFNYVLKNRFSIKSLSFKTIQTFVKSIYTKSEMFADLSWMFIQFTLFIINLVSVVLARVLTVFLVIYAIIWIIRCFKTQKVIVPGGKSVLITGQNKNIYRITENI